MAISKPTSERADKADLRDPNENFWYILSTLYGEPHRSGTKEVQERNRSAWAEFVNLAKVSHKFVEERQTQFASRSNGKSFKDFGISPGSEPGSPDFSKLRFKHPLNLSGFAFPGGVSFENSIFDKDVDCSRINASFISFSGCCSPRTLVLADASVHWVELNGAKFNRVSLVNANGEALQAEKAVIETLACERAAFNFWNLNGSKIENCFLQNSEVGQFIASGADIGELYAGECIFKSEVSFFQTTFRGSASFRNAKFHNLTNFSESRMLTKVPDLRGATVHEATEWHDINWPAPSNEHARQQVAAYERLKLEMERLKKHSDEMDFFCRELRSRRWTKSPGSFEWWINGTFEITSNYGRSIARPLAGLAIVWILGALTYATLYCLRLANLNWPRWFGYSAKAIFSFLPIKADLSRPLSGLAAATSYIQSALGLILVFLIVLALRNRFRIK